MIRRSHATLLRPLRAVGSHQNSTNPRMSSDIPIPSLHVPVQRTLTRSASAFGAFARRLVSEKTLRPPECGKAARVGQGKIASGVKSAVDNLLYFHGISCEKPVDKREVSLLSGCWPESFNRRFSAGPGRLILVRKAAPAFSYPSIFSALMKASCGIDTLPNSRIFFLPFFCFSSSFFLRVISPP